MFEVDPEQVTFALLITLAGAGIAAAIVTAVVSLILKTFPSVGTKVTGAVLAFILSAILYVLAGIAVGVNTMDEGLTVFLAWLVAATASIGIHESTSGGLKVNL